MNGCTTKSKGKTSHSSTTSSKPKKGTSKAKGAAKAPSAVRGHSKKTSLTTRQAPSKSTTKAVASSAQDANSDWDCSNPEHNGAFAPHPVPEKLDEIVAGSFIESLQETEFKALLEETSARVIQTYWKCHKKRKMVSKMPSTQDKDSARETLQSSQEPNIVTASSVAGGIMEAPQKAAHMSAAMGKAVKVLETARANAGHFPDPASTLDEHEGVENVEPTSPYGYCASTREGDPRPRSCGFLFEAGFMSHESVSGIVQSDNCTDQVGGRHGGTSPRSTCAHPHKDWRDGSTQDSPAKEKAPSVNAAFHDGSFPAEGGVDKGSRRLDDRFRASEKVQSIMDLLKRAERQDVSSDACSRQSLFALETQRTHADDTVSTSGSMSGLSSNPCGAKSTQLAESIYGGFKCKVQSLRKELEAKNINLNKLQQDLESARAEHRKQLEELQKSHVKSLEEQKSAQDADLRQRLEFIDALLVDKDKLSSEREKLLAEIKEQQQQHEKEVEALKLRWSDELKRQKESWQSSEKTKRDQWQAQKKKEISEMTAKAMEPKLVQMAENYTSEINRLKDKIATQERLLEEHERHSMQLRDRLMKEREDAVEKERVMAHARLMQEKEKHKMEIESVVGKAATDVEREKRSAAAMSEEQRKRHKEELSSEIRRLEEETRQIRAEAEREKTVVEQNHSKALSRVREECGAEREGWKEAIRERAERQMRSELEKRKKMLEQERDEEIQVVLVRLEEEKRALRDELQQKDAKFSQERHAASQAFAKREAAVEARVASAEEGQRASRENAERIQQHAAELSKELDRRAETVQWLESQVCKIRQESLDREAEICKRVASKEEAMKAEMEASTAEKAALRNKEKAAKQQVANLKRHHQAELSRVEVRVKETLFAKDAKINTLVEEINGKQGEIENLKKTLLKHKQELDM